MKKFLFLLPIILMVAAACNSSVSEQTSQEPQTAKPTPSITQNQNPSPVQTSETVPAPVLKFKTVTNDLLQYSVSIPQEDKLSVDAQVEGPINFRYAIEDAKNLQLQAPVTLQMHAGESFNGTNNVEDFPRFTFVSNNYASFTKPFTTAIGLKGMIYNNPNSNPKSRKNSEGKTYPYIKESVVLYYPNSLAQDIQPPASFKLKYPLIEIAMWGTEEPFTADQQNLFMKVVNSFKFTGKSPSSNTPAKTELPVSSHTNSVTIDAATKIAVVQAVRNGFDIFASNDAAKTRTYLLTEYQKSEDLTQYKAMNDSQILQVAMIALGNYGKPPESLATNADALWKLDGNTVTITTKSNAAANPAYPALSILTVTYQAVYINGAWY